MSEKKKLIVCEGPDGLGKSTLAAALAQLLGAREITSPSKTNSLSFLRDVTKTDPSYSAFERQALHTLVNLSDFYENFFAYDGHVVADRFLLSMLAYGIAESGGADAEDEVVEKFYTLADAHKILWEKLELDKKFDVSFLILEAPQRYGQKDQSYHEQAISWKTLKQEYNVLAGMGQTGFKFLSDQESLHVLAVDSKTPEQVLADAREILGV